MLVDERRATILETIENKGFVSLQELTDLVAASESTVRRDLEYLDSFGQIRRTRGGAAYVGESILAFDERQFQASDQKKRIARFHSGRVSRPYRSDSRCEISDPGH